VGANLMNNEEKILRSHIREAIKIVKKKRQEKALIEEDKLRSVIRGFAKKSIKEEGEEKQLRQFIRKALSEAAVADETPHASTAINSLEDLIKVIVPQIADDYKDLTTSQEQRDSFRAHIIVGVKNLLAPQRAEAGLEDLAEDLSEQEITLDVEDERPSLDKPLVDFDEKEEEQKPKEETELETFGIEGKDFTGRNFAFKTFKKIEKQIVSAYADLGDADDKETFYDYLITNLKLYFDKFEDELQTTITPEPTTPEYEKEKGDQAPGEAPPEEELGI
tara:strand:+ start:307 stop:1137 length:831 start_codon:yes stop_codon:yes gene_type:complete